MINVINVLYCQYAMQESVQKQNLMIVIVNLFIKFIMIPYIIDFHNKANIWIYEK